MSESERSQSRFFFSYGNPQIDGIAPGMDRFDIAAGLAALGSKKYNRPTLTKIGQQLAALQEQAAVTRINAPRRVRIRQIAT